MRVTNTGYTAVISPKGEILSSLKPFEDKYLIHNLTVETMTSYFTSHKVPWFKWISWMSALILFYSLLKRGFGPVKQIH